MDAIGFDDGVYNGPWPALRTEAGGRGKRQAEAKYWYCSHGRSQAYHAPVVWSDRPTGRVLGRMTTAPPHRRAIRMTTHEAERCSAGLVARARLCAVVTSAICEKA